MPDSPRDPAAEAEKMLVSLHDQSVIAGPMARTLVLLPLMKELIALRAFKAYAHQRLDEAGIPTHPDGPHSREGCRVGDRLDIITRELVERHEAVKMAPALAPHQYIPDWQNAGDCYVCGNVRESRMHDLSRPACGGKDERREGVSINCMKCGKSERQQPYGFCAECSKPYLLVDELKSMLSFDNRGKLIDAANAIRDAAYDAGFVDGILCYSWMKDGKSYVGTTGRTLVEAVRERKKSHNYSPRT